MCLGVGLHNKRKEKIKIDTPDGDTSQKLVELDSTPSRCDMFPAHSAHVFDFLDICPVMLHFLQIPPMQLDDIFNCAQELSGTILIFFWQYRERSSDYGIAIYRNTTSKLFVILGAMLAFCSRPLPLVSSKSGYK